MFFEELVDEDAGLGQVGEDVACVRGEHQRRVGGNDLSSESSLMIAGVIARAGALVGELVPLCCVRCLTRSTSEDLKTYLLSIYFFVDKCTASS